MNHIFDHSHPEAKLNCESRGFKIYEEGDHYWANGQIDGKGPKEMCATCLVVRDVKAKC